MKKILFLLIIVLVGGCLEKKKSKEYSFRNQKIYYNKFYLPKKFSIAAKVFRKEKLPYLLKLLKEDELKNSNSPDLILLYNKVAGLYIGLKNDVMALTYLKKSLILSKKIFDKEDTEIALSYRNIAVFYEKREVDFDKSLAYFKKSSKVIIKKGDKENKNLIKKNHNNIGFIYYLKGNYTKALKYYEKSDILFSAENMGVLYLTLGSYNKAIEYTKKALKNKKLKSLKKSKLYTTLGILFNQKREYNKALAFLTIALNLHGKYDVSTILSSIYHNIGIFYENTKKYPQALDYYYKAIKANHKLLKKENIFIANNYERLANVYIVLNNLNKVLPLLNKSLIIKDKQLEKNNIGFMTTYKIRGDFHKSHTLYEKAYLDYKKAFQIFSQNKYKIFTILNNQEKLKYLQSKNDLLYALLDTSILDKRKNTTLSTLNYWINYKRSIFDIENSLKIFYIKTKDISIKIDIDLLVKSQRKLARLYQESSLAPQKNEIKIKNTEGIISKLEISLSSHINKSNYKRIGCQDISKKLQEKELYMDFAKIKNNYFLFTLDKKENITLKKLDTPLIEKIIKNIQMETREIINGTTFANIKKAQNQYAKLYDLIFSKIDMRDKNSLIISPDGLLSLIPFEAFYDKKEKKYLIEKVKISYIPSGKEFVNLSSQSKLSNNEVVVFANPDFGINKEKELSQFRRGTIEALYEEAKEQNRVNQLFSPLDGTEKEALIIQKLYPNSQVYKNKEASETNFFKISQPKILHLSTHGFFLKDEKVINPMLKSGIALSGANHAIKNQNGEGIVTALEISGLNLKGTELVVLSACETGVGEIEEAEGVAGLNKAFMKAGARYIVMSLWSVSDSATATLMENFYKNIKNKKSYGTALRDAKLKMIRNGNAHPYYWGGFVGVGWSDFLIK
jgi:CHAT domain-containing protein